MNDKIELGETQHVSTSEGRIQTIVKVGAAGGTLQIVGVETSGSWKFRVVTDESTMNAMLSEEDLVEPVKPVERPWVETWQSAMDQFNKYSWEKLYPMSVHPDFRKQIAEALKSRLEPDDEYCREKWSRKLGMTL
jgi:hypothetical protein